MTTNQEDTMNYPTSCMSAYCGETSTSDYCKTCRNRPALNAYREWAAQQQRKIPASAFAEREQPYRTLPVQAGPQS